MSGSSGHVGAKPGESSTTNTEVPWGGSAPRAGLRRVGGSVYLRRGRTRMAGYRWLVA